MLGETDENWRDCVDRTIELAAGQRDHLPDGAAVQHDDQRRPAQGHRPVRGAGRDWPTKRRWVREAFEALEAAGYTSAARTPRSRIRRGPGSSTPIGSGRAPTWSASAWRRSGTSTASTCRTSIPGRPTPPPSAAATIPLSRAYRPTDEERLIREFVLQLKRGSIAPAYFREKYRVNILDRFREQLESLEAEGYLQAATDEGGRADPRRAAARGRAAPAVLPARARGHPLHVIDGHARFSAALNTRSGAASSSTKSDTAGIVHFSWFFRYMEEAEHALWREAGLSIARAEHERRLSPRGGSLRVPPPAPLRGRVRRRIRIAAISERTHQLRVRADARR